MKSKIKTITKNTIIAIVVTIIIFVSIGAVAKSNKVKGSLLYFGGIPPDTIPKKFAEGFISTYKNELNSVFSPDGKEFYYTIAEPEEKIMYTKMQSGGIWARAETISFSGEYTDFDPFFSPDGKRLYFISTRPLKKGDPEKDADIWYVERTDLTWSEPVNIGVPINSKKNEWYVSFTQDGTIYFASNFPHTGHKGSHDIYRSRLINGKYQEVENLGSAINSQHYEGDCYVAPDESYLIFCSSGRKDSYGQGDLYISFRKENGTWTQAQNMGSVINTSSYEYCPIVTQDSKYLFYTSKRDIYWISSQIIEKLKSNLTSIKHVD